MNVRRALLAAPLVLLASIRGATAAPVEAHGSADAYAAPGVALAWAVLRGATEAATLVTIRIAAVPAVHPYVAVAGVDPFTQQRKEVLPTTRVTGSIDVRVARSHFADFPRTEFRFYASAEAAATDTPALVVFYLGVPDTAPEFTMTPALEAYLAERLAREAARTGGNRP